MDASAGGCRHGLSLGFYPVAPGTGEYIMGSPLFDEISMQLENGKTFVIRADGNSKDNVYIQSAKLNGESFTKNYVTHKQLLSGGELSMKMVDEPNKSRGTKKSDFPYSFSNELKK